MTLTLFSAFVISILAHSTVVLPYFVYGWTMTPQEDSQVVLDLEGVVTDDQQVAQTLQETRGKPKEEETHEQPRETKEASPAQAPSETQPLDTADDGQEEQQPPPQPMQKPSAEPTQTPTTTETQSAAPGANNTVSPDQNQRDSQTIKVEQEEEFNRLREYVKLITKKLQSKLEDLGEGRKATARVSFYLQSDGQIRPDSLKVVQSSGQSKLDASALWTVKESVPFDPPPRAMTIAIPFDFGRKQ